MTIGDYQFILYPIGNSPILTDDGMEFVGPNYFNFVQAVKVLEKLLFKKNDPMVKSWNSFNDACYFLFNDGNYKVNIELNTGSVDEKAEMISIRTNYNIEEGNATEALRICSLLCDSLNLYCWSMKLRKIVDLNDFQDVKATIDHFNKLRNNV